MKPRMHKLPSGGRVPEFSTPTVSGLLPCQIQAAVIVPCLL